MAATGFHLPKTAASTQQQNDLSEEREKSRRSVFVGNIPYEATEEHLREIFGQAGPVLSFRLVYDRESGKPKGYGFCEYKDLETAQSAMRNLNGVELHGRNLRVDSAASEKNKEESRESEKEVSPYGKEVSPDEAPEVISQAVASLPPEQMFELMKQMKICIQNNPDEARQMLLQNPQLAFALLQAQVIMKIVDPKVAHALLHQPRGEALPTSGPTKSVPSSGIPPSSSSVSGLGPGTAPPSSGPGPVSSASQSSIGRPREMPPSSGPPDGWRPSDDMRPDMDVDLMNRDFRGPPAMEIRGGQDLRGPPGAEVMGQRDFRGGPPTSMERDEMCMRDMRGPPQDKEFRDFRDDRFREYSGPPFDPRDREISGPMMDRGPMDPRERGPPQGMEPRDPRMRGEMRGPNDPRAQPPQRGTLDRGPPEVRPPGEIRGGPPDSWGPPPERRGPIDPRVGGGDPRASPREDRMMREGRPPPPEMRGPPVDPRDPRSQSGPPREQRGGPPFERWGPPDPRGPPNERRGMPPEGRGIPRGPPGPPDARFRPGPEQESFYEGRPPPPTSQGGPLEGPPRGPNGHGSGKPGPPTSETSPFQQW